MPSGRVTPIISTALFWPTVPEVISAVSSNVEPGGNVISKTSSPESSLLTIVTEPSSSRVTSEFGILIKIIVIV